MALYMTEVNIYVDNGSCVDGEIGSGTFALPGKVRLDDDNQPIINVALKSFVLEYERPLEYGIGHQHIKLDLPTGGKKSGMVSAKLQLRPATPDRNWLFKGSVTALVIADLVDGS
ncbi:hypothetical protein AF335_27125 [Streptomyces eurocidicus]|uniref:Uncharacterized protein n=1 Tax=Streptomyces eurocidicus TaxID=66423 RepID=A0A2N8NQF0_STREU|nr:hypothetical protein [Streptomyces eurocidicus]MBB5122573.1 hypothetical protein [Streptomyces eurocidicus]MBF6055271.1 hypothetical protein [Streptomyces eurocidicus]PNE30995.1 hypothetical protein AF335_27125 [Streptomyces eurocidicus]